MLQQTHFECVRFYNNNNNNDKNVQLIIIAFIGASCGADEVVC